MDILYNWIPEFFDYWYTQSEGILGYNGASITLGIIKYGWWLVYIGFVLKVYFDLLDPPENKMERYFASLGIATLSTLFTLLIGGVIVAFFFPILAGAACAFLLISSVSWLPIWGVEKFKNFKERLKLKKENRLKELEEFREAALRRLEKDGLYDVIEDLNYGK